MKAPLTILMAVVLLVGLVFSGPAQTVTAQAASAVTITPETLQPVDYGSYRVLVFTATCNAGFTCQYIDWRVKSGSLPPGISFYWDTPTTTRLAGAPAVVGTFSFSLEAYNSRTGDSLGSRDYELTVTRATPVVSFANWTTANGKDSFDVYATHENEDWEDQPSGKVSVLLDGASLADCTDMDPALPGGTLYLCTTGALVDLEPGSSHTLQANFTPGTNDALNYNSTSAGGTWTVLPKVQGMLFEDLNRDGGQDSDEGPIWGHVYLDRDCNGTNDYDTPSSTDSGLFSVEAAPGDYCLSVLTGGNWRPTNTLPFPFTLAVDRNEYFAVGFYDIYDIPITFGPETIPNATVGEFYAQTITIDGGKPPYRVEVETESSPLPEGMTFDVSSLTLSGTPTTAGNGYALSLRVWDADGTYGARYWELGARVHGTFALASSANPSAPGESVTFTFSGSGAVAIPGFGEGPIPPLGLVAFYDEDTLIGGCEEVILNWDLENDVPVDQPAVCTTSALPEGSHAIRADLTDVTGVYMDPTRALTQVVQAHTNTAPTANPGGPYLGAINTAIAFGGGGSSDAEGNPLTYAWAFGDGSVGTAPVPTHTFAAVGIYDVCLTVNDGTVDSAPICTMAVVYDPSAGFVSGGGWIDSQAGAYKPDPTLSGQATFGFVSKYKKGATVPEGDTEFQFQAGGFRFHSTAYEWLVVDGKTKAQFKGSGLVNGGLDQNGNAYKFMLWAADGSPDSFRMRIWWEAAGVETVVYDNGFNQAIGGGSIVVHTGK